MTKLYGDTFGGTERNISACLQVVHAILFKIFPEALVRHYRVLLDWILNILRKHRLVIKEESIKSNLLVNHAAHFNAPGVHIQNVTLPGIFSQSPIQHRIYVEIKVLFIHGQKI